MQSRKLTALALALVPALAGCSTLTYVTTKGATDAFRPIKMSRRDTCETQKQIAEHNSRYDTMKTGKETVYRAPCQVEKPAAPKTS